MEQVKVVIRKIGQAVWWVLQKLLLVIGALLQAFGNWIAENSKHK